MPISTSWRGFINNLKSRYKGGKEACYDMSDGSKICASQKAWSVFYATMRKRNWNETKKLSLSPEDVKAITPRVFASKRKRKCKDELSTLTNEELEVGHAYAHSMVKEYGDEHCQLHFVLANEMIDRKLRHIGNSMCDRVVYLAERFGLYDPEEVEDNDLAEDDRIVDKLVERVCKKEIRLEGKMFKNFSIEVQKEKLMNLSNKIKKEIVIRLKAK